MDRYFNTSGPCLADEHYMLPPERRLGRLRELVDQRRYFTLAAGRQTGKTTSALWLLEALRQEGRFFPLWVDLQPAREVADPAEAFRTVLSQFELSLAAFAPEVVPPETTGLLDDPRTAILRYLMSLSSAASRPVVLMLDEADGLVGEAMLSFLTQLRAGYIARKATPFPASVALIGQRRVRDYALSPEERGSLRWLGTTSPFNVEAESLTLAAFTREEVGELLGQHTQATGQPFEPAAVELVFELSQGHPWLVNALAYEAAFRDVKDRSVAITAQHVETGRARIIAERRTHLDSLEARLREPRVQRVLEPLVLGQAPVRAAATDIDYVAGLALVRRGPGTVVEIANPIYREIIVRDLADASQRQAATIAPTWLKADGRLDFAVLLDSFLAFWRLHAEPLMKATPYHEAAPHIVLMAFLHCVENGGRLEREAAAGTGRVDILLRHGPDRLVVEVKVWRDPDDPDPLREGLGQLDDYLSAHGLDTGWLIVFDRRPDLPRLSTRTKARKARTPSGRRVVVIRA